MDLFLKPYGELDTRWIKDLNGKGKTIKSRENRGVLLKQTPKTNCKVLYLCIWLCQNERSLSNELHPMLLSKVNEQMTISYTNLFTTLFINLKLKIDKLLICTVYHQGNNRRTGTQQKNCIRWTEAIKRKENPNIK